MSEHFTDYDRKEIARKGYDAYSDTTWQPGKTIPFKSQDGAMHYWLVDGATVHEGESGTGLDAVVLKDPASKTMRVIYRGSQGDVTSGKDWTKNDWPMMAKIATHDPAHNMLTYISTTLSTTNITPYTPGYPAPDPNEEIFDEQREYYAQDGVTGQLEDASRLLKKVLRDNPGYSVEVYGHSLGAMDGQYAVSSLDESEAKRVKGAWLYEGPNIYSTLPEKQKRRARSYGYKVKNYVDPWDFIAQGYADDSRVVGQVQHVHSVLVFNPVKQHLWGGYRWNPDGSLKIAFFPLATDDYMNNLSRLRASWGDGRKLSASQGLFLDSELALVQEQACDKGMADLERTLETLERQAAQEADVKWGQVVSDVQDTIARDLDRSQVEDALRAAGWTRASFTRRAQADARDQFLPVRMVIKDIYATGIVTRAGIQKQLDADASLAADFNEWDATIYENTKKKTK